MAEKIFLDTPRRSALDGSRVWPLIFKFYWKIFFSVTGSNIPGGVAGASASAKPLQNRDYFLKSSQRTGRSCQNAFKVPLNDAPDCVRSPSTKNYCLTPSSRWVSSTQTALGRCLKMSRFWRESARLARFQSQNQKNTRFVCFCARQACQTYWWSMPTRTGPTETGWRDSRPLYRLKSLCFHCFRTKNLIF